MIDFSPLWETMEREGITQYKLLKSGIDNKTLDTLKKNNNITLLTLEKLCKILNCTPNDIVRFDPDTENQSAEVE
ncbi:helix-turn-helix transcriptional regulator [Lachnospiraceae bacterium OttesenSCG-928-D06]|nr:helix-turn-helix transcriptional regulator [Lachnospiraceae bacterium OttesenSCG-928-D06]